MKTLNQKTMTIKLRRIDVCDLMIACLCADDKSDEGSEKWKRLHDVLKEQLKVFDAKEVE